MLLPQGRFDSWNCPLAILYKMQQKLYILDKAKYFSYPRTLTRVWLMWPTVFLFPTERSQDSEVVMLSDSNSTQDAFTDPTSSQDSSHKAVFGKASSSSSESTTPVKDGHSPSEDTRMCLSRHVWITIELVGNINSVFWQIWSLIDL